MNKRTVSAECAYDVCAACVFEDCACSCHAQIRRNQGSNHDDSQFIHTENDEEKLCLECWDQNVCTKHPTGFYNNPELQRTAFKKPSTYTLEKIEAAIRSLLYTDDISRQDYFLRNLFSELKKK
jgi:hypothetical protein